MPGKSGGGVIGYRYYIGMHMAVCRGPIDALLMVTVGDRILYSATNPAAPDYTTSQDITISQNELFGGDMREGGISGTMGLKMGEATQVPDTYLQGFFGAYTPAFKGVVSIILKEMYIGVNPYLKDWAFLVSRCPLPPALSWTTLGASQIVSVDGYYDANPAFIVYECITTTDFGMGYTAANVDLVSFQTAANTLKTEGFGLSLLWDQQSSVQNFIQKVLNHINGVLYVSQTTGLFTLKLIRPDYTVSSLLVLDETNIKTVDSYQRLGWGETTNEIVVRYTDRVTASSLSVTVQDLANMQAQGNIVSATHDYPGICDANLAYRVAQRDLQTLSTPLSKLKITVNRAAWNLMPGDVFVWSWAKLGISSMVFRIGEISKGKLDDGYIQISAAEDVFALPAVSYISRETISAPAMQTTPIPATAQRMLEATFWDFMIARGLTQTTALAANAAFAMGVAARPAPMGYSFQFQTNAVSSSATPDGYYTGYFSPHCTVPNLAQELVSSFTYTAGTDMNSVAVGDYGYIGNEIVSVAAINTTAKTLTINRGVLDTVPVAHSAGGYDAQLFVTSALRGASTWEYVGGEIIYGYILPQFPQGTLPKASATVMTLATEGRIHKPYPPGNLKVNGTAFPATVSHAATPMVITWSQRNRLTQTAYILLQSEGDVTPETGTTYSISVTNNWSGSLLSVTGVTGNTYTFTPVSTFIGSVTTVTITTVVGGVSSHQSATTSFTMS